MSFKPTIEVLIEVETYGEKVTFIAYVQILIIVTLKGPPPEISIISFQNFGYMSYSPVEFVHCIT